MLLLAVYALTALAMAAGLASLVTAIVYRRRVEAVAERAEAALRDADGLAESLRGLQAALELQLPVTPGDISTAMPRTEALVLAATARNLRRSWMRNLPARLADHRATRTAAARLRQTT